jgi:molybdopterin/thiamine biosynthesis adenylyltransferase
MSDLLGVPGLEADRLRQASVLLAGAGNIGSPLASLLARAGVRLLRLVDRDVVEEKNLANQDFRPCDVGKPKAVALADRLREQVPDVVVEAHHADLETLPLGLFAVDLVLGALDSRRGRQALVSEIAWPLGTPVVDGGVGEGLLGRVQVFVPGADHGCLVSVYSWRSGKWASHAGTGLRRQRRGRTDGRGGSSHPGRDRSGRESGDRL